MLKYTNCGYRITEEILRKSFAILWAEHLKAQVNEVTNRKERVSLFFNLICCPLLTAIISEWFQCYNCEGAYKDFYALKLYESARTLMFGENKPNAIQKMLLSKPDVKIRFFYDSDDWEALNS